MTDDCVSAESESSAGRSVLGVGVATLDVILTVPSYPAEDMKIRADERHICRGGNVTNSLVVLTGLGHRCSWVGVMTGDEAGLRLLEDLADHGIDVGSARLLTDGVVPTSYIVRSEQTGTRTIVHYRDCAEYGFDDFSRIGLADYDWIHFEGRNVDVTRQMLARARARVPATPLSVEIEQARHGIDVLLPLADVLLFSRAYAYECGFQHAAPFLAAMAEQAPQARLFCAWGVQGAWSRAPDGAMTHSPAFPPRRVVDTRGAGDTFNAGVIDACLRGLSPAHAVAAGCRLAGRKCGVYGLDVGR